MMRSLFVTAFFGILSCCLAQVEKAEESLTKAREVFESTMSDIRKDVLKQIVVKDEAERNRPNADTRNKLKAIKAEQEALTDKGEVPKWIDAKTKDRITKARAPVERALETLWKAYLVIKEDDKAAAVEEELKDFKKGGAVAGPAKVDAFQPKTKWVGEATRRVGGEPSQGGRFELTVLSRDGKTFKARVELGPGDRAGFTQAGNTLKFEANGKIEDGKIEWGWKDNKSQKGTPEHDYSGELKSNHLSLKFKGVYAKDGKTPVEGTVELDLMK
jgi:hypothetical protein